MDIPRRRGIHRKRRSWASRARIVALWVSVAAVLAAGVTVGVLGVHAGQEVSQTAATPTTPPTVTTASPTESQLLPPTVESQIIPSTIGPEAIEFDRQAGELLLNWQYDYNVAVGYLLAQNVCIMLEQQDDIHGAYNAQAYVVRQFPDFTDPEGFGFVRLSVALVCPGRYVP